MVLWIMLIPLRKQYFLQFNFFIVNLQVIQLSSFPRGNRRSVTQEMFRSCSTVGRKGLLRFTFDSDGGVCVGDAVNCLVILAQIRSEIQGEIAFKR